LLLGAIGYHGRKHLRSPADLSLRIGIHSGPVTAGVLRGDRARFQLFGDTVNTGESDTSSGIAIMHLRLSHCDCCSLCEASRIESCGMRERVHLSEQTALQLIKHGRDDWIVRREDCVQAKGKGNLVTFWLKLAGHRSGPGSVAGSVAGSSELGDEDKVGIVNQALKKDEWNIEMPVSKSSEAKQRTERLAEWNSEILLELLHRVVVRRAALPHRDILSVQQLTDMARSIGDDKLVVEEVVEVIDMPDFVAASDTSEVELSDEVVEQLRDFVTQIAARYNDNPCKHASAYRSYHSPSLQASNPLSRYFPLQSTILSM
jgi:Adenylate and Guanylate cyclase catalytic domain